MRANLKKISLVLALVLSVITLASCAKAPETPSDYKLASDLDYVDYYLFVPSSWTVNESSAMTSAYVSEDDKTIVSVIQRDRKSNEDATPEYWYENYYIPSLRSELGDKLVEKSNEEASLDGVYARKYYLDITMNGITYNYIVVCALTNASFYCVTYTSVGALYEKNLDTFNDILTKFKFD